MAQAKPLVVIGLLGPTLDSGKGPARWERWRPSVALFQHEDLMIQRFELLHQSRFGELATLIKDDIQRLSPDSQVRSVPIEFGDAWDFESVYAALLDFAKGYAFAPEREDYLIHITTGTHVAQICLFLLTESHYLPGRLIQSSPPKRTQGGHGSYEIIDLDLSKYDRIASRFQKEQREGLSFLKAGIDTKNQAYNRLIERIEQVALLSSAPILLLGPTGAGKSQLARRIFELKKSRRKLGGEFVDINCATLRGDAAMSTLFGHVKGAFTGALGDRSGLLRKANGGLLFLDEIGELGLDEQAVLLRAIEEKVFLPMGSDKEVKSDFQLLAGTNRDLQARVAQGLFREDLLSRIHLWTFELPGLRNRPEDIPPNLDYELAQASRLLGVHVTMSREARERYLSFAVSPEALWPGNFRDLNASLTRMATLCAGGRIDLASVDEELLYLRGQWKRPVLAGHSKENKKEEAPLDGASEIDWVENILGAILGAKEAAALDPFDKVQLALVLRVCQQSRSLSEAGRNLFASSRENKKSVNDADRLRKYLQRFGLDWNAVSSPLPLK